MKNLQAIKQRFGILGSSTALDSALATAVRVANTDLTVLITGESGVGKEAFSKIIHSLSSRKHNNFIAINCGAIPAGTINSELFGHEKGAFTGASSDRKGYFETVDGGTIFLDEVGEMPLDTQAFLLRILESGEYLRVGSSTIQKTDVRIIAATNVNLEEKIRNGKFREDLYYRLNTVPIKVPALKDRREDIHLLFRYFAAEFGEKYRTTSVRLDENAVLLLSAYPWPGNIRELKNVAEQLSVMTEEKEISAERLLELIPKLGNRNLPSIRPEKGATGSMEEREILYKLLFDMKNDLNHLKSLVFELISDNDLNVPDVRSLRQLQSGDYPVKASPSFSMPDANSPYIVGEEDEQPERMNDNGPLIINRPGEPNYEKVEEIEENLSLKDMEITMITRALKKHKSRRKDAAAELGISERTLYRKIKEYKIDE
ncbi:MAG: sigma-54 interaction domain-containing protein [Saprospiraceae bacterium]